MQASLREAGFWPSASYGLDRLLRFMSGRFSAHLYYLYEQPLPIGRSLNDNRREVFQFDWISQFDDRLLSLPRPKDVLVGRFEQSSRCLLASREGTVVGCAWFVSPSYIEDEVDCIYSFAAKPHAVWDYDVYIVPAMRIGRLFMKLWQRAADDLVRDGYRTSLSRISAYNRASIRAHERLGAKRIAWAWFMTLGTSQLMLSSQAPHLHTRLWGKSKPRFELA
jgi:hypothetical protein